MGSLDGAGNEMGNMTLEWTFGVNPVSNHWCCSDFPREAPFAKDFPTMLEYQRVLGGLDAMVDLDLAGIWRFGGAAP